MTRDGTHAADAVVDMIATRLREGGRMYDATAVSQTESIANAAALLAAAFQNGRKLLLCGNGGSAADCQHMAAELVSRLTLDFDRPGLPAIALTTDTSILTAYANDLGFDGVFARQVQALGKSGDVLMAISTSGRSPNVLQAIDTARGLGLSSIGLFGEGGASVPVDVAVVVPSRDTQLVQQTHLAIEHLICYLVERRLYPAG